MPGTGYEGPREAGPAAPPSAYSPPRRSRKRMKSSEKANLVVFGVIGLVVVILTFMTAPRTPNYLNVTNLVHFLVFTALLALVALLTVWATEVKLLKDRLTGMFVRTYVTRTKRDDDRESGWTGPYAAYEPDPPRARTTEFLRVEPDRRDTDPT